jgi:hypothetical protein
MVVVSVSSALGMLAVKLMVEGVLASTLAASEAIAPGARDGTEQVTVAAPVAGVGVQPVIVPVPPVNVAVAGMASVSVVGGVVPGPEFPTLIV